MENHVEAHNDKKSVNKAKSYSSGSSKPSRNGSVQRKSFSVDEAVRSLDLALGRLKKSKLVNGECCTSIAVNPVRREDTEMYMDINRSSNMNHCLDNTSLMSMNFSHYELIRNLSCSNHSDTAFSGSTCNTELNAADSSIKDEHLERYFRSAEMWTRINNNNSGASNIPCEIPEK